MIRRYFQFACRLWFPVRLSLACTLLVVTGCGTTTQKLATEQLLMSDAVDTAIAKIDFHHLAGQRVYLDAKYIKPVKAVGFVNSDYIISSLRQQLAAAQCLLQDTSQEADIIIEPRVGALGTDGHEITYGTPRSSALTTTAALFTSTPFAPTIPEISVGRNDSQSGIAKVLVFAYERESKLPVWQSGVAKSESTSSSTWFMGAGPFQKGSIYKGFRFAGRRFQPGELPPDAIGIPPSTVAYDSPFIFDQPGVHAIVTDEPQAEDGKVEMANHETDEPDRKE